MNKSIVLEGFCPNSVDAGNFTSDTIGKQYVALGGSISYFRANEFRGSEGWKLRALPGAAAASTMLGTAVILNMISYSHCSGIFSSPPCNCNYPLFPHFSILQITTVNNINARH